MKKIYLHIGLHKTATTFLQNNVFNKFDDSELIYNPYNLSQLLNNIFKLPQYKDETITQFKKELLLLEQLNTDLFISYEIMSGNLFSCYDNYDEHACILQQLFEGYQVEIIIVLRYQTDWLISTYRESVHEHHYQDINAFLNIKEASFEKQINTNSEYANCNALSLDYFGIIKTYQTLFNNENVHILFFEDFLKDKSAFIRSFENILGCRLKIQKFKSEITNRGYSSNGIFLLLKIVRLLEGVKLKFLVPRPIFFFGDKSIYMKDHNNKYRKSIKEFIEEENLFFFLYYLLYKIYYKIFGRGILWRKFIKSFIDKVGYKDKLIIEPLLKEKLDMYYWKKNRELAELLHENLPAKYLDVKK